MIPGRYATRRKRQFLDEVERIKRDGELYDPCTYCKSAYRQCRIVVTRKDRQRSFHCLECFKRSKKCSHGIPGSKFLEDLEFILKEIAVEQGDRAARKRRQESKREEKDLREVKGDRQRQEEIRLKCARLEALTDEAAMEAQVLL